MCGAANNDAGAYLLDRSSLSGDGSLLAFRTAVNPLRRAIPASRKPWTSILVCPCDACVAPLDAAGKTCDACAVLHRCKPGFAIALRSPCFAQARGDHPWPSVRRVRRTLGEPARRMRRARVLHALENK